MKTLVFVLTFIALSLSSSLTFADVQGFTPKKNGDHYTLMKNNMCVDIPTNRQSKEIQSETVILYRCENIDWQKWKKIDDNTFSNMQHPQCRLTQSALKCDAQLESTAQPQQVIEIQIPNNESINGYTTFKTGNVYELRKNDQCADIPTDAKSKRMHHERVFLWYCSNLDWQKWQRISAEKFRNVQHPQCFITNAGLTCIDKNLIPEAPVIIAGGKPVVEVAEPVVEIAEPVVEVTEPVVEVTEPVVEVAEPVVEVTEPVVEVTEPVVEVTEPVVEVADRSAEKDAPNTPNIIVHAYAKNEGPSKNPHKGWNSGWWEDSEESSVGFQYLKWKDFEPTNGNFNLQAVEDLLERPGTKGRHFILRLHCDWEGLEPISTGCPTWLYNELGVARLQGDNGRYITDFNNPVFISEAIQAIQALARYFDDDPRAHVFQIGVLGYWGEWHTHNSEFNGSRYEIDYAAQQSILNAYKNHFSKVKLQARYPWREPTQSTGGVGFHNDYFVANNGHSDEFDHAIDSNQKWLHGPIGGESPPRQDHESKSERLALFETNQGLNMIETGHYTTMKPGEYRRQQGEQGYEGYMRLHKKMGYNFQIETAEFSETATQDDLLTVNVHGENIGIAPLYYDWDVQIALINDMSEPVVISLVDVDLTAIIPGNTFTFSTSLPLQALNQGSYKLSIRIIQPNADRAKEAPWKLDARNTYILFSNDLTVIEGAWDSNNALQGGWSVLGNVIIQ